MMTARHTRGILLAAALSTLATLAFTRPAAAQYPVAGQDGHANDANNRVGSGGYNSGGSSGSAVTPNNIVNKTVSGGYGFRGPVSSGDPGSFRAFLPGDRLDQFVRNSSGVPMGAAPENLNQPHPYYGTSRFAPPPPGSLPAGFNGGYIGTTPETPLSLSSTLSSAIGTGGLQERAESRDEITLNNSLNTYGYPGINNQNQQGLAASPLFGIRRIDNGEASFLSPGIEMPDVPGSQNQSVIRMRQEMLDAARGIVPANGQTPVTQQNRNNSQNPSNVQNPGQDATENDINNPAGSSRANPAQRLNPPLTQTLESPERAALTGGHLNSRLANAPLNSSTAISPQSLQDVNGLVPANRQSPLLDALDHRLQQFEKDRGLPENPTAVRPTSVLPKNRTPTGGAPSTEGPQKVSSLATGIAARGLHDLLWGAEELMRQGKFDSAIDNFNKAQRVAPNNPLAPLGRAHAELAAGYYAQADQDLRSVWRRDPELLMAQFDLPGVITPERMQFLHKDLLALAKKNPTSERPWFLLAYLDYNSGDAAAAEKDLNEAGKRAGSADWTVRLLKSHWSLPSNNPRAAAQSRTKSPATPTPTQTPTAPGGSGAAGEFNK